MTTWSKSLIMVSGHIRSRSECDSVAAAVEQFFPDERWAEEDIAISIAANRPLVLAWGYGEEHPVLNLFDIHVRLFGLSTMVTREPPHLAIGLPLTAEPPVHVYLRIRHPELFRNGS